MKKIHYMALVFLFVFLIFYPVHAEKIKIKTVDGVQVIENPKKPDPPKGTLTKLILKEDFNIGEGETEEQMFSEMSSVAVDDEGNIYILDREEKKVKVFDSKGKFVNAFGKEGQGPGEMQLPVIVQIAPTGELVVEDAINRKLMFFSLKGEFLRSLSTANVLGLTLCVFDTQGNIIGQQIALSESKLIREAKKYDKDLKPMFTFATMDNSSLIQGRVNLFSIVIFYQLGKDDTILLSNPEEYEIKVINPEGKLIKRILKEYDPVKITKKDQDEIMERLPSEAATIKDRIEFPKLFPAYQSYTLDEQGRLFVQTFEKGKKEREYYIDVFDAEGRYIAKITLDVEPVVWKRNKLYARKETEDGYHILKCYSIRWEK